MRRAQIQSIAGTASLLLMLAFAGAMPVRSGSGLRLRNFRGHRGGSSRSASRLESDYSGLELPAQFPELAQTVEPAQAAEFAGPGWLASGTSWESNALAAFAVSASPVSTSRLGPSPFGSKKPASLRAAVGAPENSFATPAPLPPGSDPVARMLRQGGTVSTRGSPLFSTGTGS
ncbi:MAG TPA: hypothetical protein VG892_10580 [Terriglobales bacterium]|nr:hypothetical protein [Terriglobales bacterium]